MECVGAGNQAETPTLLQADGHLNGSTAPDGLLPTAIEGSPPLRPRSGRRLVASHPVHISSEDSSFETELGPLGRSLEAGPLRVSPLPAVLSSIRVGLENRTSQKGCV
jgi:hypothetical protein